MPGLTLSTEAIVIARRPPTDAFECFTLYSADHGVLPALRRLSRKAAASVLTLDLFDEASFVLENNQQQGQAWFIKEVGLLARHGGLGRDYEVLQAAADIARLLTRNNVSAEGRPKVYHLLRDALAALEASDRPDIIRLKTLYRFARDEGYPLREHWFPALPVSDRQRTADLLNLPSAGHPAEPSFVSKTKDRLEDYLRGHTEILLD